MSRFAPRRRIIRWDGDSRLEGAPPLHGLRSRRRPSRPSPRGPTSYATWRPSGWRRSARRSTRRPRPATFCAVDRSLRVSERQGSPASRGDPGARAEMHLAHRSPYESCGQPHERRNSMLAGLSGGGGYRDRIGDPSAARLCERVREGTEAARLGGPTPGRMPPVLHGLIQECRRCATTSRRRPGRSPRRSPRGRGSNVVEDDPRGRPSTSSGSGAESLACRLLARWITHSAGRGGASEGARRPAAGTRGPPVDRSGLTP